MRLRFSSSVTHNVEVSCRSWKEEVNDRKIVASMVRYCCSEHGCVALPIRTIESDQDFREAVGIDGSLWSSVPMTDS